MIHGRDKKNTETTAMNVRIHCNSLCPWAHEAGVDIYLRRGNIKGCSICL